MGNVYKFVYVGAEYPPSLIVSIRSSLCSFLVLSSLSSEVGNDDLFPLQA